MSPRIITLLTDFGTEDYFVGAMKGVILTRSPEAVIVDVTHAIPSQDVRAGAFILSAVYHNFPAGSIHLAVVDPGVGSDRRPVLIEAADYLFVGPDNGLFSLVLDRVPAAKVRHVTNTNYFLPDRSSTFHGRDIFAPVAAALAQGVRPGELGPIIQDPVRFGSSECELLADGTIVGRVIHIDHFGNCVTNFAWKQLQHLLITKPFCLRVKEHEIQKLLRYYSEATTQLPFVIVGSAGFLEISIRCSSAARELKIAVRRLGATSLHTSKLLQLVNSTRIVSIEQLCALLPKTAAEALGVEIVSVDSEHIVLRMPMSDRARQPLGLLHGGISMVLAETAASLHACWNVDLSRIVPVGIEINGSHIRSASEGHILANGKVIRRSSKLAVHNVEITHEESDRLLCLARVTNFYKVLKAA